MPNNVQENLQKLEDGDIHVREEARWALISAGSDVVPQLINMLKTDSQHCRWEAAKLLGEIRDPRALEPDRPWLRRRGDRIPMPQISLPR